MDEIWKHVVGYEGKYEVSSNGRVRNAAGRILTGKKRFKYLAVELYKDGVGKFHSLHVLVLETFVYQRPQGMCACHNNGQYHDNRASNLRWATHKENSQDMVRHGTVANRKNGKQWSLKLTPEDVEKIKTDHRVSRLVAKDYGVSSSLIRNLRCGIAK